MSNVPRSQRAKINGFGPPPAVIGAETARAAEAERRRIARGPIQPSPMPAGGYGPARGELDLLRPVPRPLDGVLVELCRKFAESPDQTRANMRAAITMEESFTLLFFAKRAAVFALRERGAGWVVRGVTAVAMIEAERVDYRDILITLGLLNHAAERLGADAGRLFADATRLAEPGTSRLIEGFSRRTPERKQLHTASGFAEVETAAGIGFVGWRFKPYYPSHDLVAIAIEMSDVLEADKYEPDSIDIATDLPSVWLDRRDNTAFNRAFKGIRAVASGHGRLRTDEHMDAHSQLLIIFLAETADESAAQTLLALSKRKQTRDYAMLGLAEGNLLCLAVARSWVVGVESCETAGSLRRFSGGFTDVLRRRAGRS